MSSPLKKDSTLQVTEQEGVVPQMSGGEGGSNRCLYILRVTEKEDLICWIKRIDSGVSTLQVIQRSRGGLVVSTQVALPGHGSERIATVPYKSRFSVTIAINCIQHG